MDKGRSLLRWTRLSEGGIYTAKVCEATGLECSWEKRFVFIVSARARPHVPLSAANLQLSHDDSLLAYHPLADVSRCDGSCCVIGRRSRLPREGKLLPQDRHVSDSVNPGPASLQSLGVSFASVCWNLNQHGSFPLQSGCETDRWEIRAHQEDRSRRLWVCISGYVCLTFVRPLC